MSQTSIQSFLTSSNITDTNQDPINALLLHRYTNTISQDPNTWCFNVIEPNGSIKKCGGLIKRLQKNFYSKRIKLGQIKRKKGSSSRSIGTMVHRQIHHLITCEKLGKCNCDKKTSKNRLNKYTKLLFEKLKELNIEPIATEIPIYNKSGGFCTRLDMIGRQNGHTPLIISLKTGHSTGFNRDSRNTFFDEPFEDISSTSQNINQLQSLAEYQILKREYNLPFTKYLIIYLGKKSTLKSKKLESTIKNSKKKQGKEELIYIEEPAKWCWNILPEKLNVFYKNLNKI